MSKQRIIQYGKASGIIAVLTLCLLLSATITSLQAQSYPTKPIKLVVGYSPGGPTDVMARTFSTPLSENINTPVIVDNQPGAGGNVAAGIVARAENDGYTLLFTQIATHGISPNLYSKLPYNAKEDFTPIIQLVNVPELLVVTPSMPVENVGELIAYLRKNPGVVNFASGGNGTSMHLSGELFKFMTGTQMTHIPYKGSSKAYPDLMAGRIQLMFDPFASIYPFVESGRLKGLAVSSKARVPAAPEIPTIDESGLPDFIVNSWFGVVAPKGTPSDVIIFLNQALSKVLQREDVLKQLASRGAIPVGSSPPEFAKFIDSEIEKWGKVVKFAGMKID